MGNKKIGRYSCDDLEILTRSRGGNAYYSDEVWVTDEEATKEDEEKVKKLVCVDKWWHGRHVSILFSFNIG